MNLDLKTVLPLGKVLRASLLRYKKSISDDPAFLISKLQPCLTSSGLIVFCLFLYPQSVSVTLRVSSDRNDSFDERTQSLIDKRFVVVDDVNDKWV